MVHLVKYNTREEGRSILPSIGMLGCSDKDYMVKVRQSVGKLNGLVFSVFDGGIASHRLQGDNIRRMFLN